MKINITQVILNENFKIAHSWFQIGSHCKWSELKRNNHPEKNTIEENSSIFLTQTNYENKLITI